MRVSVSQNRNLFSHESLGDTSARMNNLDLSPRKLERQRDRACAVAAGVLLLAVGLCVGDTISEGTLRENVILKWGKPKSSMQLGREETLIYEGNVRVMVRDGKVTSIEGLGARTSPPLPPPPSTNLSRSGVLTRPVTARAAPTAELARDALRGGTAADQAGLQPLDAGMWATVAADFQLYEVREQAVKELRDIYGIDIYVPRTPELNLEGGKLTGSLPSPAMISAAAAGVKDGLARYPGEFIRRIGFQHLVLIGDLRHKGVSAGAFVMGPAGAMVANPNGLSGYHFHHELFHFADYRLFGRPPRSEGWSKLHPDAVYGSGGRQAVAQANGDPQQLRAPRRDLPGFVTKYAQSAAEEDRAEVFATLMERRPLALELIANDPVIAVKCRFVLDAIARIHPGMREALGY